MEFGSTATRKHKNPHKKLKETEDDDIFGKLPEPLISCILSFLSTEDVVRTSVLSKKWINRWRFVTNLNLDDSDFFGKRKSGSKVHFVNFVNRALLLTQGPIMETISLVISQKYEACLLNTWISGILIRRVKILRICVHYEFPFSPPTSHLLFSPQDYLEELVLEMWCCSIKLPPCCFLYFSSLKLLKLCEIIFTFDSSLDLNLPNLKKFETENCFWVSACAGSVTVDAPLLETIFIVHDYDSVCCETDPPSCATNFTGPQLNSDPRTCAINFTGSQLKEITYRGAGDGVSPPIILQAPSSARNASAKIILFEYDKDSVPETESRAFMLLKQFSQVNSLKFDGLEVLTQPNILPVFPMLCHLELCFITCEVLLGLLQRSPFLKTLTINEEIYKFDKELLNMCVVPECLIHTLQIVKFKDVNMYEHGHDEHQLYLAELFLENGMVLERMTFSRKMKKFKEKLLSFKKGFSSAIIEFLY